MSVNTVSAEVLERIKAIVGPKGWTSDADEMAPHFIDPRGRFQGSAAIVVRPASTDEVARVVRVCAESHTAIVPQGGNTGLCGGAIPREGAPEIVLNLGRMNRVRALDPINDTITVDAGCVLANIQQAASDAERLFPLSLGSEGSCMIGGNLSTNAGGTAVLRYGPARSLVLGLEVVLADGRVWEGLRGLRKDNTGYDLKQLFIGAEGTLGVITGAVLKLFPMARDIQTAFVAFPSVPKAVELLSRARVRAGEAITAFELLPRLGLEFVMRHMPEITDPFTEAYDWYAIVEFSGADAEGGLGQVLETLLAEAARDGVVRDAVIAQSTAQARTMWSIREGLTEVQKFEGGSIKSDVSVPLSRTPEFIARATEAIERAIPGVRSLPYGHMGDGNVHLNLSQPVGGDEAAFLAEWPRVTEMIHDLAAELGGSISAEHGLGQLKREEILRYKSKIEMELMRTLKKALDPDNIMNPGKVV